MKENKLREMIKYVLIMPILIFTLNAQFQDSTLVFNLLEKGEIKSLDSGMMYFDSALSISESINFKEGVALSYLSKGELNYYLQNYSLSEKYLFKSIMNTNKYDITYEAQIILAQVYQGQGNYQKALNLIDSLLLYIEEKKKDQLYKVTPLSLKSRIYNHFQKTNLATNTITHCYKIVNNTDNKFKKMKWGILLAEQYIKSKKLDDALILLKKVNSNIEEGPSVLKIDSSQWYFYKMYFYKVKAELYSAKNNPEKSIGNIQKYNDIRLLFFGPKQSHDFYINNMMISQLLKLKKYDEAVKFIKINNKLFSKESPAKKVYFLKLKSDYLYSIGDYMGSSRYMREYIELKDSVFSLELANRLHYEEIKYERNLKGLEVKFYKEKAILAKNKTLLILFLSTSLIVLILLIIKGIITKNKLLQRDIDSKTKALITYSLKLAQKNNKLKEIDDKLIVLMKDSNKDKALFRSIKNDINLDKIIKKDWDEFEIYFEKINKDFYKKLLKKFPSLTNSEVRILSLIYLGFSNLEIQNIIRISDNAIKSAKQRIKKKLNLDSTKSIRHFLTSI